MKGWCIVCVLVLIGISSQEQVSEKLKQIVKLQLYIRQLEKDYSIVQKGLTTIGNIKGLHLSLDQDFFAGLESVNPNIKTFVQVADIASMRTEIIRLSNTCLTDIRNSDDYSNTEQRYIRNVLSNLLNQCDYIEKQTTSVLSSSVLQMPDGERLRLVGQFFMEMQDRYAFCRSFISQLHVQAVLRVGERNGIGVLVILNGN